jgi:hypothetical protein
MPIGTERREYERFPCTAKILHSTNPPDFFYSGTMYNFSKRGLYFESDEDLSEGHEISISIIKPQQKFTKKPHQYFDVKIMWCQKLSGSSYQVGCGAKLI